MVKKIFLILFLFFLVLPRNIVAETQQELQDQIDKYNLKLQELGNEKKTLSNQIKIIDTQIFQTQLKIKQTSNTIDILKKDIADLGVKIGDLDVSLNQLSAIYIHEINQNYKLPKRIPLLSLISSGSFNNFFENYKYLSVIQKNSQENLLNLETTRTNLDLQKQAKAEKQKELEAMEKQLATQQKSLDTQKNSKSILLSITQNDEKKYLSLKQEAENELNALLTAKFTGKRHVNQGEVLGLMGDTGYSFGAHLHFGLYNLKEENLKDWIYANDIDPIDYLKNNIWPMSNMIIPADINKECAEDYRMASVGIKTTNPNLGSITQCRGLTRWSKTLYKNGLHNGIDLVSKNIQVKAIKEGEAYFYRGNSSLGNHVKLFHPDGKMSLYLHLQ